MKYVALHNLGCKVNAYEFDVMQQMLQESGFGIVSFDEKADVYIVNTCSVTNMADRKSRQMLHKAKKTNPESIVVATGCYVQTGTEELLRDLSVDLVVGNNKKKDLISILNEFMEKKNDPDEVFSDNRKTLDDTTILKIDQTMEFEEMQLQETSGHTRAYIKIQDGCNQFCSYCIIPYARGRIRSRKDEDVIKEVRGLAEKGYKEIVLTGIHLSSYGKDRKETDALAGLLEKIHEIPEIQRIRLGSLEPRVITKAFLETLNGLNKVCRHFHLSLQSGSNDTLKRMNRHYTKEEFLEKVEWIREFFPKAAITTDVIVGFPGETEEEFLETKEFLETIRFFEMHIFKFSRRKGTLADKMENQIGEEIKTERSQILMEMEKEHSKKYRSSFLGEMVSVLVEEEKQIKGSSYLIGHTPEYVKVAVKWDENKENQILDGTITGSLTDEILLMS